MRNIIPSSLLILIIALIFGCTTVPYDPYEEPGADEVMDTQDIYYDLSQDVLPTAIINEPYSFSYCDPLSSINGNPLITDPSEVCSPPENYISQPSGGNPPYHFQLDSGKGFPPMGTILHPNGYLDGTPTSAGTSTFSVCAVDQSGEQKCSDTMIEVKDMETTLDSLTCEKYTDRSGYLIIAKGTARGGSGLRYTDSIWKKMNTPENDCLSGSENCDITDLAPSGSDCGTWTLSSTNSCTPEYNYDEARYENEPTSWTLAYWLRPGRVPITLTAEVYIESDYRSVPRSTTPVTREVTCG